LLEDQARVIEKCTHQLPAHRVSIIGHSMGGSIGLLLAKMIEPKVNNFINLEVNLTSEDCGLLSRKTISTSYEVFRISTFREIKAAFAQSDNKASKLWATWAEKADSLAFYKSAQSLVHWSDKGLLLEKFLQLAVPKYYIYGDKNADTVTKHKLFEKLSTVSHIAINNAGHFVMNDNPTVFYDTLYGLVEKKS